MAYKLSKNRSVQTQVSKVKHLYTLFNYKKHELYRTYINSLYKHHMISISQYRAMHFINNFCKKQCTNDFYMLQTKIAKSLKISESWVKKVLRQLRRLGLIVTRKKPNNMRVNITTLSVRGIEDILGKKIVQEIDFSLKKYKSVHQKKVEELKEIEERRLNKLHKKLTKAQEMYRDRREVQIFLDIVFTAFKDLEKYGYRYPAPI